MQLLSKKPVEIKTYIANLATDPNPYVRRNAKRKLETGELDAAVKAFETEVIKLT